MRAPPRSQGRHCRGPITLGKKEDNKTTTLQEQDTSDGEQDQRAKKQHHNGITSSGSSKQPYSVSQMRGADGGDVVVGSLSWQLLQTSAVHSIVGEQCSAGSATDSVSAGAKRRQRELRGSADTNLAISTIA